MAKPLVSIFMPTYRRPQLLRHALASAVSQTYDNLQIVVRDNASGDETPEVVRSFHDPRIEFYQAERTGSGFENGNECFAHVKGEYVFLLCDDDVVGSNYAEVLLGHLERDKTVLVGYGATDVIDANGVVIGKCVPNGTYTSQGSDVFHAWCAGNLPLATGVNYFCRPEFLRGLANDIQFIHGQNSDNAMFTTGAIRGKVLFTDQCTFYYRKHAQNSGNFFRFQERLDADESFLGYLDDLVHSDSNVGLPAEEWPRLREKLCAMLTDHYFQQVRTHHLGRENPLDNLHATTLAPSKVYGGKNCLKYARRNIAPILRYLVTAVKGGGQTQRMQPPLSERKIL